MFDTRQEHNDFHYASEGEADQHYARALGAANPDCAWINSDRDVWYANPFYKGPPVRHPEDDYEENGEAYRHPAQECPF